MTRIFGALVAALVLGTGSVSAQEGTFRLTNGVSGAPGDTVQISCILDSTIVLTGWSFGVCHDATKSVPVAVASGSTTLTVNNGAAPGFEQFLITTTPAANAGVTHGVVINLLGMASLPPGNDYEMLVVDYELVGADGDVAPLTYCTTAAVPPVDLTVVNVAGASIAPATFGTSISIEIIPLLLFFGTAPPVAQGASVEVPVLLTTSFDVYGFGMGISHDPTALDPIAVEPGAALTALNAGSGPDFFLEDLDPEGGSGVTVGCLVSTVGVTEILAPGTDLEILRVTYSALPSAPMGDTTLDFVDNLSPGAPAPAIQTLFSTGEVAQAAIETPGIVTIEQGGAIFVRGDVSGNVTVDISDPINLLGYLFAGDAEPPCLDAGDFDNSGNLDIGDAVNILSYLFSAGAAPAAPFPDCGNDPEGDGDGLSCQNSAVGC